MTAPAIDEAKPRSWVSSNATIIDDEARDRADREVDATGDDDESFADRQNGDNAPWRKRLETLLAVQNVVVSTDSASHMQHQEAE